MARRLISSGGKYEALAGYSRAVVEGDWVFVAGTGGFDYTADTISDDVVEQTEQTLRNIKVALAEAGATMADIVRVTIYITDQADFVRVAPVLGKCFGQIRPANTAVVCQLIDPRMKVEISATAHLERD